MRGSSSVIRGFLGRRGLGSSRSVLCWSRNNGNGKASSITSPAAKSIITPHTVITFTYPFFAPFLHPQIALCSSASTSSSSSSTGPSNIVLIKSEEQFNSSMKNAQDKSLPAVFYFTAVWCGPCRFVSPVIEELSKKYPDVTTFKIDIDQECLRNTLSKLFITAVPTFHFFQNGKKAAEIVGADVEGLKNTMEELYGKD